LREHEALAMEGGKGMAERMWLPFLDAFRRITLIVLSNLEAAGLTEAVPIKLAENRIRANPLRSF
jgi:hypothetical protein